MKGPRVPWISRIAALGLLAQMFLSWPLWHNAGRLFPVLPAWSENNWNVPLALSQTFVTITLLLLAALLLRPASRWLTAAVCAWLIVLVATDINRLQPWLYYYALIWIALLTDAKNPAATLRWIIAMVYIWGGLFKLTPWFANENFAWFCEAFSWTTPLGQHPWLGYASALGETMLGAGLLWRRTRPVFRWLPLVFHGYIILALSPAGLNWNPVVIPWNLAMAIQAWLLFHDSEAPLLPASRGGRAILLWAGFAPLLHIAGVTPETIAWKLYTNTQSEATFAIDRGTICPELRPIWSQHAYDRKSKLMIDDWAMATLHTPAARSRHATQRIGRYLCRCVSDPGQCRLLVLEVNPWQYGAVRVDTLTCNDLLSGR